MNAPAKVKKAGPQLNLTRLSAVAQIAVAKPSQPADTEIELDRIYSVPQVRQKFVNIEELAASIKLNGMVEPIVVHEEADGKYRVIVGERRFRAAPIAGLTKVPAIIKRGLTALEIRRIQVTENNDRDDLTAFEEAMGVVDDVAAYGTKEAMLIWNRSEGWISKRVAVKRYAAPVRELLENDLCGDFEVLHSLNQIYDIEDDHDEFERLATRLRDGLPLSRDEARNLLARQKSWKKEQEELARRRSELALEHSQAGEAAAADVASAGKAGAAPENAHQWPYPTSKGAAAGDDTTVTPAGNDKPEQQTFETMQPTEEQKAAAARDRAGSALDSLRNETFEWGEANQAQFNSMKTHMVTLGYDLHQTEWVMWQGFLAMVLPMLEAIGPDRASSYLKKLQGELKGKTPLQLWEEVHPEEAAGREPAPDMPEGWRF
ncbi:chromosome partitioning protein ParB [Burkholderia cepacia]|uniref:ParB/RepB/Spo0J family partition protein n=1 Tax=Burkholderia cepacia TaxID=292 RepID=UPI000757723F|nr:ParB/RepB/Spo0J family partition protein [Burkholderia cepacia]KVV25103.1 chromosome partitioning protein ParB [Burkholderia cepacia]